MFPGGRLWLHPAWQCSGNSSHPKHPQGSSTSHILLCSSRGSARVHARGQKEASRSANASAPSNPGMRSLPEIESTLPRPRSMVGNFTSGDGALLLPGEDLPQEHGGGRWEGGFCSDDPRADVEGLLLRWGCPYAPHPRTSRGLVLKASYSFRVGNLQPARADENRRGPSPSLGPNPGRPGFCIHPGGHSPICLERAGHSRATAECSLTEAQKITWDST